MSNRRVLRESTLTRATKLAATDSIWARRVLSPDAVAVYRFVAAHRNLTEDAVMDALGFHKDRFTAALRILRDSRLLRHSGDPGQVWLPVAPELAVLDLLSSQEAEIRDRQARLMEIRDELLNLSPAYLDGLRGKAPSDTVNVMTGSIYDLVAEEAQYATAEVCVAESCEPADQGEAARHLAAMLAGAPAAVRIRMVVNGASGRVPTWSAGDRSGWELRVLQPMPLRLLIFDGNTAVLPAGGVRPSRFAVIRQPDVLRALADVFDMTWSRARPIRVEHDPAARMDRTRMEILCQLAAGHKDEVVARRLGLSVRTCRRHIAEIMEQLGATSRFQAGLLASDQLRGGAAGPGC
jgi:DNA-binding CsgD family transcriptional regulator